MVFHLYIQLFQVYREKKLSKLPPLFAKFLRVSLTSALPSGILLLTMLNCIVSRFKASLENIPASHSIAFLLSSSETSFTFSYNKPVLFNCILTSAIPSSAILTIPEFSSLLSFFRVSRCMNQFNIIITNSKRVPVVGKISKVAKWPVLVRTFKPDSIIGQRNI